ncbi:MAG: hypothetical protein BWK80_33600 [Desulfobacteraceae bacterium IS3]|nr:MAG: hypothetical protein BWK80_33600 [Desulfobacteraceae bacterium IS3]
MKKFWFGMILLMAISLLSLPVYAEEEAKDITEEVLTGPSELNPEKILGPGSVGIGTYKDIMMSFGATVRMIPTFESNWDFGMSDNTDGFFYTEPVKTFARGAYSAASAANNVYESSIALNNAMSADRGIQSAFDDYANSLFAANSVLGDAVKPAADGAAQIQSAANAASLLTSSSTATTYMTAIEVGTAASAKYQTAIASKDIAVAGPALQAIASDPAYQAAAGSGNAAEAQARAAVVAAPYVMNAAIAAADAKGEKEGNALRAVFADTNYQAAAVAGNSAGMQSAAQSVVVKAVGAAGDAAANSVIKSQSSPLIAGGNTIVTGVTQNITKNPNAGPGNISDALAYTTALNAQVQSFSPYYLADSFLRTHSNESGSVNDGYIRTETKLYFNAMPKDKKWSFYAALEYDKPIDTNTVDNRGGKDSSSSNFGLERLNASIELSPGLRFHGGWDVWGVDVIESASMVYGDDNAGFWLTGIYDKTAFSAAWLKLEENDFQNDASQHRGVSDEDRDLFAGYFDLKFDGTDQNKMRFFYVYDRIRNVPSLDLTGALAARAGLGDYAGIYGNNGIARSKAAPPDTDAHTVGGYYLGKIGVLELMVEGAYKFGEACDTGLQGVYNGVSTIQYDDFDISSYAFAGDIGLEFGEKLGWQSFRFHLGAMFTSGDDDADDDKLGGYSGATNAQRFSRMWGGENTIIGDTSFAMGTALYGYIPEFYGNGTPVFVGGLQNFTGTGNGRGDNPGLTMYSVGLTLRPRIFLIYHSNVNMFHWNEDFYVGNMVQPMQINPATKSLDKTPYTKVEGGYAGTEWDNEITLALSKNMFVKAQASFFFPGDTVKEVTKALGAESDETASRLGFEFIWNF